MCWNPLKMLWRGQLRSQSIMRSLSSDQPDRVEHLSMSSKAGTRRCLSLWEGWPKSILIDAGSEIQASEFALELLRKSWTMKIFFSNNQEFYRLGFLPGTLSSKMPQFAPSPSPLSWICSDKQQPTNLWVLPLKWCFFFFQPFEARKPFDNVLNAPEL